MMSGLTEAKASPLPTQVLIVDDSSLMRRALRDIVQADPGLRVAGEATHGKAALELLAGLQPDVILLDLEMPVMGGLDFLRAARLQSTARVVVVSSAARPGSLPWQTALELGADDILPKTSGALSLDMASAGDTLRAAVHRVARLRPSFAAESAS